MHVYDDMHLYISKRTKVKKKCRTEQDNNRHDKHTDSTKTATHSINAQETQRKMAHTKENLEMRKIQA